MHLDRSTRRLLADAALSCAASQPWRQVTIFDLASAAGRPVEEFAGATPGDALDAVEELFDQSMARGLRGVDTEALVRDRLFDIVMRRFEAMEAYRPAVVALDITLAANPAALPLTHARNARTARWALALAGLEADGVTGAARTQGLAVILAQTRSAWREDVGGDFAKTMAALDKALRQAERTFGRLGGFEGPAAKSSDTASSEPPPLASSA